MSNARYARIERILLKRVGQRGLTQKDNRLFADAVLWVMRARAPWQDLSEHFGHLKSVS